MKQQAFDNTTSTRSAPRITGAFACAMALAVIFVFVALTPAAVAQTAASTALSPAQLRDKLAELGKQIDIEREAAESIKAQQQAQIGELQSQRTQLAERLLEVELQSRRLEARAREVDLAHAAARDEAAELDRQLAAALRTAATSADKLSIYLRELPGSGEANTAIARTINGLSPAPGSRITQAQRSAAASLLTQLHETLDAASRTSLVDTEVWTAADRREPAALLSAGHVAFAYRTAADGRIGLAMASPADATGYRWTEQLDAPSRAALVEALSSVATDESTYDMLIDVSGRLQPAALIQKQTLAARLQEGGPVMWPLAFVALLPLALMIERAFFLYGRNANSSALARRVLDLCRQGSFDEALAACATRRGAVARTMAAALERRTKGQQAMEDSIQAQLLSELPALQRFMGGIAILAAVAPLLGLLGTVTGIIHTFGVIRAFGNANPSVMAGGISEALLTTAAGLIIAVPILLIHALLSGRVDRIVGNAEKHAANLLAVLTHDAPKDDANRKAQP